MLIRKKRNLILSINIDRIPHVLATGHLCKTNISSCTAFRGFGAPQAMMITEDFMDKLAVNLKMSQKQVFK